MTFLQMPVIYPENPMQTSRFRLAQLVRRARYARSHDDSLRIAYIGNSTWTSPSGSGVAFHHHLTHMLQKLFGNTPGTTLADHLTNAVPWIGGGSSNAKAFTENPGSSYFLPGRSVFALPFASGEGNYQPAMSCTPESYQSIARNRYLTQNLITKNDLRLEFRLLRATNSVDTVKIRWAPTDTRGVNYFKTVLADELIQADDIEGSPTGAQRLTRIYRTTARTAGSGLMPQWYLQSAEATTLSSGEKNPPAFFGMRVLTEDPRGAMIDFLSAGGYQIYNLIGRSTDGTGANHANCLPLLESMDYDIICLGYGIGVDPDELARDYYDHDGTANKGIIGELFKTYREAGRTPPLVIVANSPIFVEGDNVAYDPQDRTNHDAIAARLIQMADEIKTREGEDIIVLNVQRHTYEAGFNEANNEWADLTNRGVYDTGGVSYVVDDMYSYCGNTYKCIAAHTSSASTEPWDDSGATIRHSPARMHLADTVHRSFWGAKLEADAWAHLFEQSWEPDGESAADAAISRAAHIVKGRWH